MLKKYKCIRIEIKQNIAIVQINRPPLNQVSGIWIKELKKAFTSLFNSSAVNAIILTGTDRYFIGGMDISWITKSGNCDAILPDIEKTNKLLFMIEKGPKPVVAAINGNCTRGGMEVAMACHYRIASETVHLGLLDVRFGLIPCMGGTQRLPRLIGIKQALEMMTRGEAISAGKAKTVGLIDEVTPPEQLIEKAVSSCLAFVAGHINYKMCVSCKRFDQLTDMRGKKRIVQRFREKLKISEKGYLAPFKVVEAVENGLGLNFEKDLQTESTLFCECADSHITRNLIGLFDQSRLSRNVEWLRGEHPKKIRSVGILGTGTEASRFAFFLLRNGFNIWLWNEDMNLIRQGLNRIRASIASGIKNGLFSKEASARWLTQQLKLTNALDDLKQAELVIDCTGDFSEENISVSHQLFRRLEAACGSDTLLASTASISPVDLTARGMRHPERVICLRFMKPLETIRLLEIVSAPTVSDSVLAAAVKFTLKIGKTPVLINDGEGFYIPRLMNALLSEFGHLVAEGFDPLQMDALFTHFGFPVPLSHMADLAGMDLLCAQIDQLSHYAPGRWEKPLVFEAFCKQGWTGQKSGLGWFDYRQHPPEPHSEALKLVQSHKKPQEDEPIQVTRRKIIFQFLSRMINETAHMIEEGLSNTAAELDMAVVYGIGFPPYHGGLLKYADTIGIERIYKMLRAFESKNGERFTPAPVIIKLVKDGMTFYELRP